MNNRRYNLSLIRPISPECSLAHRTTCRQSASLPREQFRERRTGCDCPLATRPQSTARIGDGKMRHGLTVLWMVIWSVTSAVAQVSIGIGLPGVSIGINLPYYPDLVRVPGYPVYYAPRLDSLLLYDGMYWVYQEDDWYASSWYSGPWARVAPAVVPLFILRVPVSYYRNPPGYFRGWRPDAPPRWGEHWGQGWEQQRSGWNQWNRRSTPAVGPRRGRGGSGRRHYPDLRRRPVTHWKWRATRFRPPQQPCLGECRRRATEGNRS
jgi:hypothetical protein